MKSYWISHLLTLQNKLHDFAHDKKMMNQQHSWSRTEIRAELFMKKISLPSIEDILIERKVLNSKYVMLFCIGQGVAYISLMYSFGVKN